MRALIMDSSAAGRALSDLLVAAGNEVSLRPASAVAVFDLAVVCVSAAIDLDLVRELNRDQSRGPAPSTESAGVFSGVKGTDRPQVALGQARHEP